MNTSFQRTTASDEWYTPPEILQALGDFDLDPCAARNWTTARRHYYREDNGLILPWFGRIWLNPPYTRRLLAPFICKLAEYGNGIALIFNRMDTELWHNVIFPTAKAMLVLRGRLRFYRPDGSRGDSAGCGSVLVAWGHNNALALESCAIPGKYFPISVMSDNSSHIV